MNQPFDSGAELLQVYDEDGAVLAPLSRAEVHAKPLQHWHGVANVWLVNRRGEIIVSKRSTRVGGNPGKWQSYFGGHVSAGLTHREVAVKELAEEAGLEINGADLYLIDKGKRASADHLHFYESYAFLYEGDISELDFADGEVSEAKWLSLDEYERESKERPDEWCNDCDQENQSRIRQWLSNLK